MKRALLLLTLILLTFSNILAKGPSPTPNPKPRGIIKGTVIDAESKEPLPGLRVMIEHTTVGAITNHKGEFTIKKAPVGSQIIMATGVAYKAEKKEIEIKPNETIHIDFELKVTILELGAIVVTGSSTPHVYEDQPVRTEVIPRKLIEQKEAVNLAQALDGHTGVQVENDCNNCNFTQVRIIGMDGKYTELLIDGDPVMSTLAGVYGLEHFPEEMVDQIEIVKGGGSALYGGGAVAGTINLITRRPVMDRINVRYMGGLNMGMADIKPTSDMGMADDEPKSDMSSDHNLGAVAELVSNDYKSGAYVFASSRQRNPYDHNGDGFSELGKIVQQSLGFNYYADLIEEGELFINLHHIHENRRGGNDFELPPHEADVAEALEHTRWGGSFKWTQRVSSEFDYRLITSFALTDRDSYYGGTFGDSTDAGKLSALGLYGKTTNPLYFVGATANYSLDGHLITSGVQYKTENVKDNSVNNPTYAIDQTFSNIGIFVQDNVHFLENSALEMIFGIRMDKHSELEDPVFSPRVTARYLFESGLNFRAAFGTGFKAPQPFDEDFHIEAINGGQKVIRNAPGLTAENSYNISTGIDYNGYWGDIPILFAATGFYTNLSDAFSIEYFEDDEGIDVYHRVNADKAHVVGVEADFGIRPNSIFELRIGAMYKQASYDHEHPDFVGQAGADKFLRTPDFSANFRASAAITDHFNLYAFVKFLGQAYVPHTLPPLTGSNDPVLELKESDSYLVLDLGAAYEFHLNGTTEMKLSFGVKNILDSYQKDLDFGVNRDPAYVYGPSMPRYAFIGTQLSF
jgi:outer membrane receptor for ferrienterochelin and colicins